MTEKQVMKFFMDTGALLEGHGRPLCEGVARMYGRCAPRAGGGSGRCARARRCRGGGSADCRRCRAQATLSASARGERHALRLLILADGLEDHPAGGQVGLRLLDPPPRGRRPWPRRRDDTSPCHGPVLSGAHQKCHKLWQNARLEVVRQFW